MMVLVIGGSGSGKSLYAEDFVLSLSPGKKYYLATMRVCDGESLRKVEKHRELRQGKGFLTIEQPVEIHRALEKMKAGDRTVLLECLSNLTANEMFRGAEPEPEEAVAERIVDGIGRIRESVTHLVVVGNNVFEDGIRYEETTMGYMRAMGPIHRRLAAMADRVIEMEAGIPVVIKGDQ